MNKTVMESNPNTIFLIEKICKSIKPNSDFEFETTFNYLFREIEDLSSVLGLSPKSSFLFCLLFDLNSKSHSLITMTELSKIGIDVFSIARLKNELEELIDKGFLIDGRYSNEELIHYYVPNEVIVPLIFGRENERKPIDLSPDNSFENGLLRKIGHDEIKPIELIYDDVISKSLNGFAKYFVEDNMNALMKRYDDLGLQKNFTCLYSGPSGTGKSEFIKQLGRVSGRDLYMVRLSEVKDCFVGNSEKNIQQIFDMYNEIVEEVLLKGNDSNTNRIPILVIDEVEILMQDRTRFGGRLNSVDEMHKSMVNIFLKCLEQFKGILLMTSNNTSCIDPALARRVNYKFVFPNPSFETRTKILHSELGEWYSHEDCKSIGQNFELTGGMIKNIKQKIVNHIVLNNSVPELSILEQCVREEVNGWKNSRRKIVGFEIVNR